jgi:hypothetical protein
MSMTVRLMPPGDGLHNTIRVNGRTYTQTPGNTLDVPDFDAAVMVANGWLQSCPGATVGTTAMRPLSPFNNQPFTDLTVGGLVVWDAKGKAWLHHVTGAAT